MGVHEFLSWFHQNASHLSVASGTSEIVRELSSRLDSLNIGNWEIGPLDEKGSTSFLALSQVIEDHPGASNRATILEAEAPEGWRFLPGKPPKFWSRKIQWGNPPVLMDASDWRFLIYTYDDGMMELVLCSDIPDVVDPAERQRLVVTVLESELGEICLDQVICGVDANSDTAPRDQVNSYALTELRPFIFASLPRA
jgi:hypothetical protein